MPVLEDIFHITLYPKSRSCLWDFRASTSAVYCGCNSFAARGVVLSNRLKKEPLRMRLGVALLSGGAMGNLVDRIRLGAVVDFFDFRIWPIFNVADIAIVLAVGPLVRAAFLTTKEE